MCGISNRHHPPGAPLFELHPLHGRANNLVITLKRRHVLLHTRTKFSQSDCGDDRGSLQRIAEAALDDIREPICAPGRPAAPARTCSPRRGASAAPLTWLVGSGQCCASSWHRDRSAQRWSASTPVRSNQFRLRRPRDRRVTRRVPEAIKAFLIFHPALSETVPEFNLVLICTVHRLPSVWRTPPLLRLCYATPKPGSFPTRNAPARVSHPSATLMCCVSV